MVAEKSSSPSPGAVRPAVYGVLALLTLIWGTTYFVIAAGLRDLPPFTAVATRFVLAGLVFSALAAALARREGGAGPTLRLALIQGICNLGIPYAVVYWCETVLPSGLTSVLWGLFPMLVALLSAVILPEERLSGRQWVGIFLGLLGLFVLFRTDLDRMGSGSLRAGAILLLAPIASAFGQIQVKRHGAGVSSLRLTRAGLWIAAAIHVTLAVSLERHLEPHWTTRAIFSVVYLALAGTVVTFGLYFWALRHAPAVVLSLIAYTTPVLALAVGAGFGNEPVSGWTVAVLGLILTGVALVFRRRSPAVDVRALSSGDEPASARTTSSS